MAVAEVLAQDHLLEMEQAGVQLVGEITAYVQEVAAQTEHYCIPSRPGDMYPEVEESARRDVLTLIAGAAALRSQVYKPDDGAKIDAEKAEKDSMQRQSVTMLDMLRGVAAGDEQCQAAAVGNISTMVREVTKKYQSVSRVSGHIDANGHFWQHGQDSRDYLVNTFAYVDINRTTKAEALGMLRFEEQVRRGLLRPGETYYEFSLVPDGDREQLNEAGYFLEAMSYVVRGLTLQENGTVDVEVAFVAGADQERLAEECGEGMTEAEAIARQERAMQIRHDRAVLERLHASGRLRFAYSPDGTLHSFITPRGATPHGVVDIVRLCDDITAELLGKEVFFGVVQPKEDYATFPMRCQQQMQAFDGLVQNVVAEATRQVMEGGVVDPSLVPALLRGIVADFLVPRALQERDFDLRVLGMAAARLSYEAQQAADAGDHAAANRLIKTAREKTDLKDCPDGGRSRREDSDTADDAAAAGEEEKSNEDCVVVTFCPHCSDLNFNGSPTALRFRVVARIDRTKTIHCGRCYGYAGPKGKFEGIIKPKAARWSEQQKRAQAQQVQLQPA